MTTTNKTHLPDKQHLYGRFEAGEAWKRKLQRKGAYKALDMADDDMGDIHANRIGMTWKELTAVAALVGGAIVATAHLTHDRASPQVPAAVAPPDSEYEVRFFDAHGNPIEVEHVSQRPQP
jgi:hypothetical protein